MTAPTSGRTAGPSVAPRTTTARSLRAFRFGLVAATAGVLVGSLLVFQGIRDTADAVGTRSAPSIIEVVAAKAALVEAHAAAVNSFQTDEAQLTGPGVEYQNQITIASRSLSRFAEQNLAGEAASQGIQLVDGLLVAYMNLIGQADAHYRQDHGTALGLAYLWHASRLLHMPDGGVLVQLDELRSAEEEVLARQLSSGWSQPAAALAWMVPLLALLGLLGATMRFLSRRFRRTFNLRLVGAAGLSLAVAAGASFSLIAERRLEAVQTDLSGISANWEAETRAIDDGGQRMLAGLLNDECDPDQEDRRPQDRRACQELTADVLDSDEGSTPAGGEFDDDELADAIGEFDRAAVRAASEANVVLTAPVGAVFIALLVLVGLDPRIDEYRYPR